MNIHTVRIFNSCTKCVGSPGIIHNRMQPSFQGIDAWITSELNEALVCKLRVSLISLADIFDIPSMGVLYNQALADVRSTGAGIKCLHCKSKHKIARNGNQNQIIKKKT